VVLSCALSERRLTPYLLWSDMGTHLLSPTYFCWVMGAGWRAGRA